MFLVATMPLLWLMGFLTGKEGSESNNGINNNILTVRLVDILGYVVGLRSGAAAPFILRLLLWGE